jgi:hypothetical protein
LYGNEGSRFNLTKIDSTGASLPANAASWNCVKDNVTGLMWEVKTDDNSLHDKDWTYSWYEPGNSKNGGDVGSQNSGSCGGTSICDTNSYVQAVNAAGWCGKNDWRLPNKEELSSIINYDRISPTIDTAYFINTPSTWFWTSSPYIYFANYAWCVDFIDGFMTGNIKNNSKQLRLVRSSQ